MSSRRGAAVAPPGGAPIKPQAADQVLPPRSRRMTGRSWDASPVAVSVIDLTCASCVASVWPGAEVSSTRAPASVTQMGSAAPEVAPSV
jgi:hypothetical protein